MSTRILPPPARISRVFDDGDIPLSAKAIDENWFQPRLITPARIIAQPLIDDDFVQVVVIALDDSTWTLGPALPASIRAQPWADDEVGGSLANFVADADGVALSYVQTLAYSQPFGFDEDLSFTITIVDEDGFSVRSPLAFPVRAQPFTDDETAGVLLNFGLDEDGQYTQPLVARVVQKFIWTDDEPLYIALTIIDEDGYIIASGRPGPYVAQPVTDDEVTGVFKNFGLDDDLGSALSPAIRAAVNAALFFGDDDLPQFVITIVDEDPFVIVAARAAAPIAQPISDDEASSGLKNFGLDEDGQISLQRPSAPQWRQAWADDDSLAIVVSVVDEDGTVITTIPFRRIASQPVQDDETWVLYVPPTYTDTDIRVRFTASIDQSVFAASLEQRLFTAKKTLQ